VSEAGDSNITFERDVRPLFRQKDRDSMLRTFDLWSHEDVSAHAAAILGALESGRMPCDGAWPPDRVELFRRWTESGMEG
jgi:hypothetical protein